MRRRLSVSRPWYLQTTGLDENQHVSSAQLDVEQEKRSTHRDPRVNLAPWMSNRNSHRWSLQTAFRCVWDIEIHDKTALVQEVWNGCECVDDDLIYALRIWAAHQQYSLLLDGEIKLAIVKQGRWPTRLSTRGFFEVGFWHTICRVSPKSNSGALFIPCTKVQSPTRNGVGTLPISRCSEQWTEAVELSNV